MGAFDLLGIAGSGLSMHQTWLDSLSHNIANVNTSRPTSGAAFQARFVMAEPVAQGGVRVSGTALGDPEGRIVHAPDDPMADADGYVRRPDIDMASQLSQLVIAQRGFQAQVSVVKNAQDVYASALSIGKGA
ncbi:MAG TPA: flagellar basal body rod C-terminal domain-containing protein [Nocardioidaceae bacterium]|nr:flagellar basal body rod C-terminal domain-containing protein [Nocardioidaceae bacterium]